MDELQAGIELTLAVLPQPPALSQPGEAARHHPAQEHKSTSAFGDLHLGTDQPFHDLDKWLTDIPICQDVLHTLQVTYAPPECQQRSFTVVTSAVVIATA